MEEAIKSVSNATRQRAQPYIPVNQLTKIPTYEELINYIERDPYKIKYPNRSAQFLRNSFELSFLDNYTTESLNKQQENLLKFKIAQAAIAKRAAENKTSFIAEGGGAPMTLWQGIAGGRTVGTAVGNEEFFSAQSSEKSASSIPAEMPGKKPPPDTPGGMSAVGVGVVHQPKLPPTPKAKALVKKEEALPPDEGEHGNPLDLVGRATGAVINKMFNFGNDSPAPSSASSRGTPRELTREEKLQLYNEQRLKEKEKKLKELKQKAEHSTSMVRKNLDYIPQQQHASSSSSSAPIGSGLMSGFLNL